MTYFLLKFRLSKSSTTIPFSIIFGLPLVSMFIAAASTTTTFGYCVTGLYLHSNSRLGIDYESEPFVFVAGFHLYTDKLLKKYKYTTK